MSAGDDRRRHQEPGGRRPRLAVALGDPERERRLLPALDAADGFVVAERCLAAEELLAAARAGRADALLVARDLVRLTEEALADLARLRLPLVVLTAERDRVPGVPLPIDADGPAVCAALTAAVRGSPPSRSSSEAVERRDDAPIARPAAGDRTPSVVAVAGGPGSPGRTTVAVNLAAALAVAAPTALVDADVAGPSVCAALDLDPTRNLYMIAHAEPASPRDWDRAIAEEVQPLPGRGAQGVVLCGVPRPEMRGALTRPFLERLIEALRRRHQHVVVDVGAELLGGEAALHRAALGLSDRILVVASADLVGLWRARATLALLREQLGVDPERVGLVVNRHSGRFHHGRDEIEAALGVGLAGLIPFDHSGAERAIAAQRPLVLDLRSKAGFYLLELAGRVRGGRIELPPEPPRRAGRPIVRLPSLWPRRSRRAPVGDHPGATDGDRATALP